MSAPRSQDPYFRNPDRSHGNDLSGDVSHLFDGAIFEAEVRRLNDSVAYTRPGHPGYLFTRAQWDAYDAWNALWDRQERRYGRLMPTAVAMVRAFGVSGVAPGRGRSR